MLGTVIFFSESFTNIVTITFSALIITELLNIFSTINKLNWKMFVAALFTLGSYVMSIVFLREYFDTSYITW